MKVLFSDAWFFSEGNPGTLILQRGSVGVCGNTIAFVGERPADFVPDRQISCSDKLLMPGFVNAHTHSPLCLLRGRGEGKHLREWLTDTVWPFEAKHTAESCYWGTLLNAAEAIQSGTTCMGDMYIFSEAVSRAFHGCGMRALVTPTVTDTLLNEQPNRLEQIRVLAEQYASDNQIKIGLGPHAQYTCSNSTLKKVADLSQRYGLPIHVHVSETQQEQQSCIQNSGMTPLQVLDRYELIGNRTIMAHCVYLTDEDMALAARQGACMVHCPRSNLKLGSGIARITSACKAGISVALGTDSSASSNNQDMLEELRFAALLQRGYQKDPTALTSRQCIDMATGASLSHMGFDHVGQIRAGWQADMILLDMSAIHWLPNTDPIANLLFAASSSDVRLTMVNGNILYENGIFLTIDVERIRYEVASILHRM